MCWIIYCILSVSKKLEVFLVRNFCELQDEKHLEDWMTQTDKYKLFVTNACIISELSGQWSWKWEVILNGTPLKLGNYFSKNYSRLETLKEFKVLSKACFLSLFAFSTIKSIFLIILKDDEGRWITFVNKTIFLSLILLVNTLRCYLPWVLTSH